MSADRLRVFVSSKMQELAPERGEISTALDELQVDAWVFEKDSGARAGSIRQTYLDEVENADLYLGVFWKGHGDYTIEEFEHARKLGKDCLVYEKRENLEQRDAKLKAFLDRIGRVETGLTVQWFHTPEELGEFVKRDVARWQAEIVRRHARSSDVTAGTKKTIDRMAPRQLADITKAPYKFLSYYDIGDRDIFFGRDAVIEELAGEIPRHKVLIINGQSGSGKTSLINAGLIPRLAENGYLYVYFRDYTNPLEQLREHFRDHPDFAIPEADKLSLLQILRTIRSRQESPVVVIFDQFERFLINVAAAPRREFLQQLRECLESDLTADELNLVISLRDDFFGKLLLEAEAIIPTFGTDSHHHNLRTLNRDEARQAIIQPLKNIPNIGFDGKFVDDVLLRHLMGQAIGEAKIEPPHLQIVCNQLYEAARDRFRQQLEDGEPVLIGFDLYHDLGETEGMLRDYLDDVVRRITNGDPKQIAIVRSTLKLMIETVGTRKFESVDDIFADLPDVSPSEIKVIITRLQEARVLEAKQSGNETEFSLSHEFMVAKVESWYDEREIERKRAEETFERALKEWKSHSTVLDEAQLKLISKWLPADTLGDDGEWLVGASKTRHIRQRWLKRGLLIAMVTCAILMPIAVIGWRIAQRETTRANREAAEAEKNRDLAKQKEEEERKQRIRAEEQTELAERAAYNLQLKLAASISRDDPKQALALLNDSVRCPMHLRDFTWGFLHRMTNRSEDLTGHDKAILCVAFSPSGESVASASQDRTVKVWDVKTSEEVASLAVGFDQPSSLLFSQDEKRIVISGVDNDSIKIWDYKSGESPSSFLAHLGGVSCLKLDSNSSKFVSSGWSDGLIKTWNSENFELAATLELPEESASCLAISSNGNLLAAGSHDGRIRLWDMVTHKQLDELPGHKYSVECLEFSTSVNLLASASSDVINVWNVDDRQVVFSPPVPIAGFDYPRVAFSDDDGLLATSGYSGPQDAVIKLWDVKTWEHRFTLVGTRSWVTGLDFSPDNRRIASCDVDKKVRLWDISSMDGSIELTTEKGVSCLARSPTQDLVAIGTHSATVIILYDIDTGTRRLLTPRWNEEFVSGGATHLAFSPNGKKLLAAMRNRSSLVMWDVETGHQQLGVDAHEKQITAVFFAPGESTFATVSIDGVVKHWDTDTLTELRTEVAPSNSSVSFSLDGSKVAFNNGYNQVGLLDAKTWKVCQVFEVNATCVSFGNDPDTMLIGGIDGSIAIWDLTTNVIRTRLLGHTRPVRCLLLAPDGRTLASGADDDSVRLWDVETGQERLVLRGHPLPVDALIFSSDGRALASGSATEIGGVVKIWMADEYYFNGERADPVLPQLKVDLFELEFPSHESRGKFYDQETK